MSKKTKHTNGAIGTVIKDFLPHPKELLLKDDSVKVTIWLSKESIEFFKG
ncbi:hypothetical protein A1E_01160 [Rickettsia canadensis str. McKiel]|uniref:Uncharacterized protein n=1 Tax=Rickettsia canadensis (strain McKiel) TaxID=293613 RepID=A8EXU4_RICCK|nr:hypothetical protein [Rickettsia canadensis]ABV73177.1 hypothetical protein A1E_01160 [Rickettsia canadensis str. McKiel]